MVREQQAGDRLVDVDWEEAQEMDDQKKEEERLSLPLPGKDLILLHFYLGGWLLCLYQACPLSAEWWNKYKKGENC